MCEKCTARLFTGFPYVLTFPVSPYKHNKSMQRLKDPIYMFQSNMIKLHNGRIHCKKDFFFLVFFESKGT